MAEKLSVTVPTHIKGEDQIKTGMRDVAIALIPLIAV